MNILKIFEQHFTVVIAFSGMIALIFPQGSPWISPFIELMLMVILLTVFLKINLRDLMPELKNLKRLVFILLFFLILIPVAFYFLTKIFISTELALQVLLLTGLSAGVATPALTDLFKGNTSLALVITVLTSFLVPFSLPFIFQTLTRQNLEMDITGIFLTLCAMIFIPFIIAVILRGFCPRLIERLKPQFPGLNVLLIGLIVYAAVSPQRDIILENPFEIIQPLGLLYVIFILLHALGYVMLWKEKKENRIATMVTRAYANNGLGIVLALRFFDPATVIFMVLSEIPWITLPWLLKKVLPRLR